MMLVLHNEEIVELVSIDGRLYTKTVKNGVEIFQCIPAVTEAHNPIHSVNRASMWDQLLRKGS